MESRVRRPCQHGSVRYYKSVEIITRCDWIRCFCVFQLSLIHKVVHSSHKFLRSPQTDFLSLCKVQFSKSAFTHPHFLHDFRNNKSSKWPLNISNPLKPPQLSSSSQVLSQRLPIRSRLGQRIGKMIFLAAWMEVSRPTIISVSCLNSHSQRWADKV